MRGCHAPRPSPRRRRRSASVGAPRGGAHVRRRAEAAPPLHQRAARDGDAEQPQLRAPVHERGRKGVLIELVRDEHPLPAPARRARLGGAQPGPAPVPERGRRCSRRPESGDDSWSLPSARVPQPGRSAPAASAPHVQGRPAQDAEQAVACTWGPRSCMCSQQGCAEHEVQ